ncbi:MAG: Maf family nucleotide pyrophosphatase [Bacteroidaceae bacterium]
MLHNLSKYKVIMGSASPRRHQLLEGIDIPFTIRIIDSIAETYPETLPIHEIPEYLANLKASVYLETLADDELLITADTMVLLGDQVLGKPKDEDEAKEMLRQLSNHTNQVVTGVSISTKNKQISFSSTTDVTFVSLSEEDIDFYIKKYHPMDKAGSYGVQEWIGYIGVSSINGSFYNVMGLPIQQLYHQLSGF